MSDRKAFADLGPISPDKFTPQPGRLLVKREPAPEWFGKVALVGEDMNDRRFKPTVARIIRRGEPGRTEKTNKPIAWSVKEGDRILLDRFSGHDCIINGDDSFVVLEEADVVGVLSEGAEVFA